MLHRAIREAPQVPHSPVEGDRTIQHPRDIMDRKSQKFQELWAPEGQQLEGLQSLFAEIRA
eukprot:5148457-Pyramimonas_sp.AAC.1